MPELIVALDYPDATQALRLAETLKSRVSWFKVGLELFVAAGPEVVLRLKDMGCNVFLDLKFYDIPNTAERAAAAIARLGADMLTVHCQGGSKMCAGVIGYITRLFVKPPLVIGVTVLTSFGTGELPGIAQPPDIFCLQLAGVANGSGLDGVVCSAVEVGAIKRAYPDLICVCPGIRPIALNGDDQSRIATPAQALAAGADYLVVGRPITANSRPIQTVEAILADFIK